MHFEANFDCMPFMTALKKWRWRVWGLEFNASLSFVECEFRPELYDLKNNTKQNDVFQCALLIPLYIYICKPSEVDLFVTYVG